MQLDVCVQRVPSPERGEPGRRIWAVGDYY
ncbi:MAG: hypothetical protein JWQ50_3200 [Caballeronia mineralivorans]|jgi:hypothetical protein|nr:hypothetical protein [Caballeronia mineralivorans]MEA3096018.1 hypothetical protein [Caballeronia mineralivorans]